MSAAIVTYSARSQGAVKLADRMEIDLLCRNEVEDWLGGSDNTLINWGCADLNCYGLRRFNAPEAVAKVVNKANFLLNSAWAFNHPVATSNTLTAQEWSNAGYAVVVRHEVSSSQGNGIQIIPGCEVVPSAPLYTMFCQSDSEYRVHIAFDRVINIQVKQLRMDANPHPLRNYVRNENTGYVLVSISDVHCVPSEAVAEAFSAIRWSGLDFGAVDVLWDGESAFVLEINTAPGLGRINLDKYSQAFQSELDE